MPSGIYKRKKSHGIAISKSKIGHFVSEETKLKIGLGNKGKVRSKEVVENYRNRLIGMTGKNARHWLGDKVGRIGIHIWIKKKYGKPNFCEHCKRKDRKNYDWACKDHKYLRKRSNFMRLCRSCHRKYDIKHNNYRVIANSLK